MMEWGNGEIAVRTLLNWELEVGNDKKKKKKKKQTRERRQERLTRCQTEPRCFQLKDVICYNLRYLKLQ